MDQTGARRVAKLATRFFLVALGASLIGLAATEWLQPSETLILEIIRGLGFILFFGGVGFGWVFGTIALATFLYSRQGS